MSLKNFFRCLIPPVPPKIGENPPPSNTCPPFYEQELGYFLPKTINVEKVYVATTNITSSYHNATVGSPMCITWYFLARLENTEYHELFSDKKIEKEENLHKNGVVTASFDTPYITKIEPLKEYLKDIKAKTIDTQLLFDFITKMNVLSTISAFNDTKNEEI